MVLQKLLLMRNNNTYSKIVWLLLLLTLVSGRRRYHHKKHHKRRITLSKPCDNCDIINHMQGDQPVIDIKDSIPNVCGSPCDPCPQSPEARNCKAGVSFIMDGCDCCRICARQQGDICDQRNICDPKRKLHCDFTQKGGGHGICRAINGRDCEHNGELFKDGAFFKPKCSEYCSCQNGQVTCSTQCPHEQRPPSSFHCNEPRLVSIKDRCCREWVCPHSFGIIGPDDLFSSPAPQFPTRNCKKETTPWSPCTKTCGVGVSVRHTNDNPKCQPVQERRLCLVRPCELNDKYMDTHKCRPTWRNTQQIRIINEGCFSKKDFRPKYCGVCKSNQCCFPDKIKTMDMEFKCPDNTKKKKHECKRTWDTASERKIRLPGKDCVSIKTFQLKYCSTCKDNKCCGPGDTKNREMKFRCTDGTILTEQFMWIKNCKCVRKTRCPF